MFVRLFESFSIPVGALATVLAVSDAPSSLVLTMFGAGITSVATALVYVWRQQVALMQQRMEDRELIGKLQEQSLECERDRQQLHQQLEELKA